MSIQKERGRKAIPSIKSTTSIFSSKSKLIIPKFKSVTSTPKLSVSKQDKKTISNPKLPISTLKQEKEITNVKSVIPIPKPKSSIPDIKPPIPNEEKNPKKKLKYEIVGGEKLGDIIKKLIQKEFIPTKRMGTILGFIFLAVLILSLIQFPYEKFLYGEVIEKIDIGYPWVFLELGITDTSKSPLVLKGFILDMIVYLILAYIIDIILKVIISSSFLRPKSSPEQPVIFKDIKPTIADKITKKILTKEPEPVQKKSKSNQQTSTNSKIKI